MQYGKSKCYIREELKTRGVRHWELAHELDISKQTLVRWLRFELSEDKQLDMLEKTEEIINRKETIIDDQTKERNYCGGVRIVGEDDTH
ncbi:hypothetical protein CUS_4564 [Ruminococcus albus 8]|uniref:Uncharacterized protein n=1 Tax=Ruminococcus albus 8 TaxID=246199 RepID=E9S991_RUMAL|nr:hypothetical protein CUS_4564 [Ruminococcus albus 8]